MSPYSSQNLMKNEANLNLNISKLNQSKATKNKEISVHELGDNLAPSRKLTKLPNNIKLAFFDLTCARF